MAKPLTSCKRIHIESSPFPESPAGAKPQDCPWPADWVDFPDPLPPPVVKAFRLKLMTKTSLLTRIHVSADERYELFIDGTRIGRGPERGCPEKWYYESFSLRFAPGPHTISALVWSGGREHAPRAQMTFQSGFLLAAEAPYADRLSTGKAPWKVKIVPGVGFRFASLTWGTGSNLDIQQPHELFQAARGIGTGWQDVRSLHSARGAGSMYSTTLPRPALIPAPLPTMKETVLNRHRVRLVESLPSNALTKSIPLEPIHHLADEAKKWEAMLLGKQPMVIPAHTVRRVLIDLRVYTCARHRIQFQSGSGSRIRIHWAEALWTESEPWNVEGPTPKENRNHWQQKHFHGAGDYIHPDGRKTTFEPLWWHAGRYVEILIETDAKPLRLTELRFLETGYPLRDQAKIACSDQGLIKAWPVMRRTLAMCMHETYMDCPYYEQLMYVGDTRLQALTTYVLSSDDRLPRKAIELYDVSRNSDGLVFARFPCFEDQLIPTFSLLWIGMVYDYALWKRDPHFVARFLPGIRSSLMYMLHLPRENGLVIAPPGWNFVDWAEGWSVGVPPLTQSGTSCLIQLHLIHALEQCAQLEVYTGDQTLIPYWQRAAKTLGKPLFDQCWDDRSRKLADQPEKITFSEQAQAMALLTDLPTTAQRKGLLQALLEGMDDLTRSTIYFSHYTFQALAEEGRGEEIWPRLDLWRNLHTLGLTTTPEQPEPTRSDCHAWGAHPIFHTYASLAGIRPEGFGFENVLIRPAMGGETHLSGSMPHPDGLISFSLNQDAKGIHGWIQLPECTQGTLILDRKKTLFSGRLDF